VKTHEQPTAGPSEERLALQRRLADLMKTNAPAFAAAVRYADALVADGMERDDAYRQALGEIHTTRLVPPCVEMTTLRRPSKGRDRLLSTVENRH
jgi:hypothetical protein